MTAYEILELRSIVGMRMLTMTRFWLTVTMAVFAVAYYAGSRLDIFSILVLLIFHGLIVAVGVNVMSLANAHLAALAKDAMRLEEQSDEPVFALDQKLVRVPKFASHLVISLMSISLVVYAAYLYQMTT